MIGISVLLGLTLLFGGLSFVSWRRDRPERPPGFFFAFWPSAGRSFWGWASLWTAAGIAATWALVASGLDRAAQTWFEQQNPLGLLLPRVMLGLGDVWHGAAALALFWVGKRRRDDRLNAGGAAGFQAVLSSAYLTTVMKVLSGRRGPARLGQRMPFGFRKTRDAGDFRFDFWNHALRDMRFFWPSGHTATTIALASAWVAYFPQARWWPWVGYAASVFMGLAMIDGHFHWASDVVAGASIGHIIGWVVGRRFREEQARRAGAGTSDRRRGRS